MERAEETRTDEVRPGVVPLDLALEVCARHGLSPSLERDETAWRVWFLAELKRHGQLGQALKTVKLSQSTLYREMRRSPSFKAAVRMAVGRIPWDEAAWDEAVIVARTHDEI